MATWRCPGCGTVQVEAAACFVCGQSATSCATCVHFRRAVVSGVGYCARDRGHAPLTGAEQRDCWSSLEAVPAEGLFGFANAAAGGVGRLPAADHLIEIEPRAISGR